MIVYISGPMRNRRQCNFPAFDQAAAFARSLGWDVINPADLDRQDGIDGNDTELCDSPFEPDTARAFARRDTRALIDTMRAENGDAIALLPGWENSTGARAELAIARWVGLQVLDARTMLPMDASVVGLTKRPPMPAQFQTCGLGDGMCGESEDLQTRSMKIIAEDFANRPD